MKTSLWCPFLLCSLSLPLLSPLSASARTSLLGYQDSLYLQVYGGFNKSANENLPWTEVSRYPRSGGAFVGVGRELSPLWGWRAALRFDHNKSRNVAKCESPATWGWNSLEFFADATFDLSDAFSSQKDGGQERLFNLKAFAGLGAAYTFNFDPVPLSYTQDYSRRNRMVPGLRIGLNATFRVTPQWRIGAELSHSQFSDRFNGVKAGIPTDGRTNLKVGFTYLFRAKRSNTIVMPPIVRDHRLRTIPNLPFLMPQAEETKVRTVSGRAFLDFPVNETVIYPDYRRNPQELARISRTIDHALFDRSIRVTRIFLHGYASPESPYANNTRLAKGRTAALMDFLRRKYNVAASLFHNDFTPEDWANLREFIAVGNRRRVKGDIWYDDASVLETPEAPAYVMDAREELLAVIDSPLDPDAKEEQLKRVNGGKPYRWLLKHVYPGLRHTDYIVEYIVRSYPLAESRRLIYTHPEALSVEEMYRVAQSYAEGSDEWREALTIAAKQYPDDPTANLNAACASVKARRLTDAKRFLAAAGQTEQAAYLSVVIQAMEGHCAWKMENGKVVIVQE